MCNVMWNIDDIERQIKILKEQNNFTKEYIQARLNFLIPLKEHIKSSERITIKTINL